MTLPISPDQLEERKTLRTCATCSAFDGSLCRKSAPVWQPVQPSDHCEQWTWVRNPRVTYHSAICGAERQEGAPPF